MLVLMAAGLVMLATIMVMGTLVVLRLPIDTQARLNGARRIAVGTVMCLANGMSGLSWADAPMARHAIAVYAGHGLGDLACPA